MSNKPSIRKSDAPFNEPVQSSRFVDLDGKWYFLTRERDLQGPYATRAGAEVALEIYLKEGLNGGTEQPEPLAGYEVDEVDQPRAGKSSLNKGNVLDWRSARANIAS